MFSGWCFLEWISNCSSEDTAMGTIKIPRELKRARSPKTRNQCRGPGLEGARSGRPSHPSEWKTCSWCQSRQSERACAHTYARGPHGCHRCDRAGWTARGFGGWKQGGGSPLALHLVNNGAIMIRASFQSHITNINKGLLVMLLNEPHGPQTQDSISARITLPE